MELAVIRAQPMAEGKELYDVWENIKSNREQIEQVRIDAAAAKAETDARLGHLESGQRDILAALLKIDHKIDANTASLNQAQGGIRFGKWLAGIGVTLIGVFVAVLSYVRGL